MANESSDFEATIAEVERRVEEGRASGKYPEELDDQLASEFSRMGKDPLWFQSFEALPAAVSRVRQVSFGRTLIQYSSAVPGGTALHRLIGKVVSRQVVALSQQMSTFATEVAASLDTVVAALEETRTVVRGDVLGDIDAVHHRLVRVEHRLAQLEAADGASDAADDDARD